MSARVSVRNTLIQIIDFSMDAVLSFEVEDGVATSMGGIVTDGRDKVSKVWNIVTGGNDIGSRRQEHCQ